MDTAPGPLSLGLSQILLILGVLSPQSLPPEYASEQSKMKEKPTDKFLTVIVRHFVAIVGDDTAQE